MKSSQTHLPSLFGTLLFVLGAVLSLGAAVLLGAVTLGNLLTGGEIDARETILLTVIGFEGLLLLGAAFVSIQKFLQRPSADADSSFTILPWQIAACLLAAGIAVLTGHLINTNESVNWLLLPVLTVPAVLLPILILLGLGIRGIPLGTRWRTWNILGIAMTLTPFLIFILEIFAILFIFIFAVLLLISQPELAREMERLSAQVYMMEPDPEALMELFAPFLLRPATIILSLTFFSVLVPLLEELVKPLGVWLFANRISSPAQGFALGALSGSVYALIETLGVSPQTADWASLLLTRIGTGVLHVTASALMGAGIVYAVRERRYLRLLWIYLLSVSMHGLWNALAILFTFATITEQFGQPGPLNRLTTPVAIGMAFLGVIFLIILVLSNQKVRGTQPDPPADDLVL